MHERPSPSLLDAVENRQGPVSTFSANRESFQFVGKHAEATKSTSHTSCAPTFACDLEECHLGAEREDVEDEGLELDAVLLVRLDCLGGGEGHARDLLPGNRRKWDSRHM